MRHKPFGPDELQALRLLLQQYEGPDRFRPGLDPPRYGLTYQLLVRYGTGSDTGWIQRTRWYDSASLASAVLAETVRGIGWLAQQRLQGTARKLQLIQRPRRIVL
jgi:hypothetical protein